MTHRVSFCGEVHHGSIPFAQPTLALVEDDLAEAAERLLGGAATTYVAVEGRPSRALVEELAETARSGAVSVVAAVGSGCLLDAAKLVARERGDGTGLVLVPCGAEPYRAVSRFAVVDDGDERPTVVEPRFGAATVLLVPELLAAVRDEAVAVAALDTSVHCIESMLSVQAHPYSRLLAEAALRVAANETGSSADGRARLAIAAFTAVEAFSTTKLGLAHAVASPLGTRARMTHDCINGVLGEALIQFWGSEVPGFADVAAALGVEPSVDAVCTRLASIRARAGLPSSISGLGIGWELVADVLPRAAQSSGIPVLPRPISTSDLEAFAHIAWVDRTPKEMEHAQPA